MLRRMSILAILLCVVYAPWCWALDDPDAPDYVAEFNARAVPYEQAISERAGSPGQLGALFADYEKFLDAELNKAYRALAKHLDGSRRQALLEAQKRWLAFRDAEFRFIADNWTVEQFGTSSTLSRGSYRTSLVKDRTVALLHYLKNYR